MSKFKFLIVSALMLVLVTTSMSSAKPAYATNFPNPTEPVCVEGQPNIVNNQKFSVGFLSYRWHISSQDASTVTYQLQLDVNPTPSETWINVQGHKKTLDIPSCEPVEPEVCPPGTHEQPQGEVWEKTEVEHELVCIPDEQPKEEPKHEEPKKEESKMPEAPRCPDGNTIKLPANPHVIRSGADATVNFFVTEGTSANIYYKVVDQPSWQYSVMDVKPNQDNFVSYTIHDLNPKLGYTFGIQQKFGCGGGELVTAVIIDGPESETFTLSYWTW